MLYKGYDLDIQILCVVKMFSNVSKSSPARVKIETIIIILGVFETDWLPTLWVVKDSLSVLRILLLPLKVWDCRQLAPWLLKKEMTW